MSPAQLGKTVRLRESLRVRDKPHHSDSLSLFFFFFFFLRFAEAIDPAAGCCCTVVLRPR